MLIDGIAQHGICLGNTWNAQISSVMVKNSGYQGFKITESQHVRLVSCKSEGSHAQNAFSIEGRKL